MRKRYSRKDILFACVIPILVLITVISGLWILESTDLLHQPGEDPSTPSKTLVRDGVSYFPRQDITVVLIMGIGQQAPAAADSADPSVGTADMLALMIFDQKSRESRLLVLDRDTMTNIPVLDSRGKEIGTHLGPLALSHTYGSGGKDSCENTRNAVSNLLYGLHIDYYMAMDMDSIAILNDMAGGVTVTVTEDFSDADPAVALGRVTLSGQQAISYVCVQPGADDPLNHTRTQRQMAYLQALFSALQQDSAGMSTLLSAYEKLSPNLVTDCSAAALHELLQRYKDYPLVEAACPEGERRPGQTAEFHPEEEKLDALILRLFYAPKQ